MAGYGNDFADLLVKKANYLGKQYSLRLEDKEDILSDYVIRVQSSVSGFRGLSKEGNKAQFNTWANQVFMNTFNDFFRKIKKFRVQQTDKGIFLTHKKYLKNSKERGAQTAEETCPNHKHEEKPGIYIPTAIDTESQIESHIILSSLKRMLTAPAARNCYNLLIQHEEWKTEGLTQQEMAGQCGLSREYYNRKLSHCRKLIRKCVDGGNQ
jgi:RNA polymerase sigma factor (sigma-70 family)